MNRKITLFVEQQGRYAELPPVIVKCLSTICCDDFTPSPVPLRSLALQFSEDVDRTYRQAYNIMEGIVRQGIPIVLQEVITVDEQRVAVNIYHLTAAAISGIAYDIHNTQDKQEWRIDCVVRAYTPAGPGGIAIGDPAPPAPSEDGSGAANPEVAGATPPAAA